MEMPRASTALIAVFIAMTVYSLNGWAATDACIYATSGTGMGGTGVVARGTGMGGTGIKPEDTGIGMAVVGNVIASDGSVEARSNGRARSLAKGDTVCAGETIATSESGRIQIRMKDDALFAIRPQTQLKIEKYVYGGTSQDTSLVALLQGASRFVTGKIGKAYPQNDLVSTPTATVGVRGTDHEVSVILPGDKGGDPAGTYDKVNYGVTFIKTEKGEVEIRAGQVGFVSVTGGSPVLLQEMPGFFRSKAGRENEDSFGEEQKKSEPAEGKEHDRQPSMPTGEAEHDKLPAQPRSVDISEPMTSPELPDLPDSPEAPEMPDIPDQPASVEAQ